MEKPNPLRVQDFLLFITSQNTILTLEAEHEPTKKIFTINLDSDSIGQITNDLFDSVDRMVQGLKDAADDNFKDLTLTISPQGKLTYLAVLASGVIRKEFSFTLNLIEKEMDLIEVFSRRLNSVEGELDKWKGAHESKMVNMETFQAFQARSEGRFDRLESMMKQMEQKMAQRLDILEKLYGDLKLSVPLKPDIYFNHTSVNASKFDLSDDNKTLSLTGPSISQPYPCLELLPQIPSNGKYCCELKINKEAQAVIFGITTETVKPNWNGDNCNYRYSTGTGRIYGKASQQPTGNGPFGGKDAIIKMVVDMDEGTLVFFVGDQQVNSCNISKSDKYFAYVSLGSGGDSVTVLC